VIVGHKRWKDWGVWAGFHMPENDRIGHFIFLSLQGNLMNLTCRIGMLAIESCGDIIPCIFFFGVEQVDISLSL